MKSFGNRQEGNYGDGHPQGRSFLLLRRMIAGDSAAFCRRIERLGYKVLWTPEAWRREPFTHSSYLLAKTDRNVPPNASRSTAM
jgi:alkanesulfonate monooxygenase SsuD/methylene tetrahydromethanopterin reductase-like flavin-dependent oxidoreductase (luciferase family)